jgi:hypothetical protein
MTGNELEERCEGDRWNPDRMCYVISGVERFLCNAHGESYGLMLTNGMEVRFDRNLSIRLVKTVRAGDRVTIYGVHPQASTVMRAVAFISADGRLIWDDSSSADPENQPATGSFLAIACPLSRTDHRGAQLACRR